MPGLEDRRIATLGRGRSAGRTRHTSAELPLDSNTCLQIGPLRGEASDIGTELTVSSDHVRCDSPEPEGEVYSVEEVLENSQASTSLFTSASDQDAAERAKSLEEEKEKEKLELVSDEPGYGYTTPRHSRTISKDGVNSSQETVETTPIAQVKSRTKRAHGKAASPNGSPLERQPLAAAGRRGNSVRTVNSHSPIPANHAKGVKRGRSTSEADSSPTRHKAWHHHSNEDHSYLRESSQKGYDQEYEEWAQTRRAGSYGRSNFGQDEEGEEEDPLQYYSVSSPRYLSASQE